MCLAPLILWRAGLYSHTPDPREGEHPRWAVYEDFRSPDLKTLKPSSLHRHASCSTHQENIYLRGDPVRCRFKETGSKRRIKFSLGTWLSHSPCQFFVDDFVRGRQKCSESMGCFSEGGASLSPVAHVQMLVPTRLRDFRKKALVLAASLWAPPSLLVSLRNGPQPGSRSTEAERRKRRELPLSCKFGHSS